MVVDLDLSQRMAQEIGANPKECWRNAFLVCSDLPDSLYVEGWAVTAKIYLPIEHGWVEIEGRIVDPTLPGEVLAYFPALRFTLKQARAEMITGNSTMEPDELPIVSRYGRSGMESPEYRQAFEEAQAYAKRRIKAEGLLVDDEYIEALMEKLTGWRPESA